MIGINSSFTIIMRYCQNIEVGSVKFENEWA